MALVSQNARKMAKDLAEKIDYVEIAHQADFQMVFSEFLLFPEKWQMQNTGFCPCVLHLSKSAYIRSNGRNTPKIIDRHGS